MMQLTAFKVEICAVLLKGHSFPIRSECSVDLSSGSTQVRPLHIYIATFGHITFFQKKSEPVVFKVFKAFKSSQVLEF